MSFEQCISSPESAGGYSQTSFSATDQLSLLSGMPTPAKSSENEQQTDGFPDCKCGKGTLDCSIHPSTPEKWTAYMRDSLAKTLALLESRQVYLREPDQVFTAKSCASLAWYDQSSCSWRTYQQSLVTDWEPYLETWPRWGMTVGGSAYAHPMSERRITETDGFCWRTPNANLIEEKSTVVKLTGRKPSDPQVGLADQVMAKQRMIWPTPTTSEHTGAGAGPNKTVGANLRTAVSMFPTPRAADHKGSTNPAAAAAARGYAPNLPEYVAELSARKMYPTATATAYKGWSPGHNRADTNDRLDYTVEREGFITGQSTPPMRLNPNWVGWLMGFPIAWANLKATETRKFPCKQQQPTDCLEATE